MALTISLLLLSSIFSVSFCVTVQISSASELIEFSNNVNKGADYSGTTVLLAADIDFSGLSSKFNPIGYSASTMFHGIFDGQGHTISNLAVSSSTLQHVGLFGYSTSTTIQNVVIDSTCSFTSSYFSSGYSYVGSIIGECSSIKGQCVVKNSINMVNLSFRGSSNKNSFIGGIVGAIISSDYSNIIKNCVNYGSVSCSGTAKNGYNEVGGIIGISQGESLAYNYVQNCMNYGTITYSSTTSYLAIGSIAGASMYSSIDNCVSLGTISSNQENDYIGVVVGYTSKYTEVTHCYWADDIGYGCFGYIDSSTLLSDNSAFSTTSFELSESVTVGTSTTTSLINALNAAADRYTLREYSHWLLNKGSHTVSFTVDNAKLSLTLSSQIILLPSLAGRETTVFRGWYTDNSCTSLLADYDYSGESDLSLYGKFEEDSSSHTITFDTRGGTSVSPITGQFGSVVTLPTDSTREHCKIFRWETEYGDDVPNEFTIPGQDVTLYAVWLCTHITTVNEFITFSEAVNSGSNFSGTTVFLDANIDFSEEYSSRFARVGTSTDNYFLGTFDGQGHTISNLALKSFSLYTGLFGYSHSTTIQNVVIDDTCSVISSYSSSSSNPETYYSYVGSIIGYCYSTAGSCTISNIVNMASVAFEGDVDQDAYVGGIVGYLYSYGYPNYIKNCVNYGTVAQSGTCSGSNSWPEIGGIVGVSQGTITIYNYIQNCANYGSIIHNGTSPNLIIGGIAGYTYCNSIDNCVSSGVISTNKESDYIGTILGDITKYSEVTHCYWTDDVGDFDSCGGTISSSTNNYLTSLNQTTVDKLNEYAAEQGNTWSKWFVVHLNGGRINNITQESLVEIQGHFPDPVKEESTFLSWCKDAECNEMFDPKKDSVSGITDIYAKWDTSTTITNYVVTFDFDNGTAVNATFSYGSRIVYPVISEREGYTSNGWDSMPGNMPAENITITAQWTPNNYTVTFDFGNGTTVNETFNYNKSIVYPNDVVKEGYTLSWNNYHEYMPAKNITIIAQWTPNNYTVKLDLGNGTILTSIKVTFNSPYGTLPTPAKGGYTFVGWVTDNNDTATNETIVTIPNNHTLHARWKEIPTQYVEIVFGTKDMTEEEVNDLVKKYANEGDFTIIKVEGGGDGDGTRVIIKFNDAEKAENFVEVIKESGGTKNVGFISEGDIMSFTITYCPMALLGIFIWM